MNILFGFAKFIFLGVNDLQRSFITAGSATADLSTGRVRFLKALKKMADYTFFIPQLRRFVAVVLLVSAGGCGGKKSTPATVQSADPAAQPEVHAPVQVRVYQVEQTSYPDGSFQEFGLYVDNHTPDTLCTLSGLLTYCGQSGDTLALLDFKPAADCSTEVMLITGNDTVIGTESFHVLPGKASMESVLFRWKDAASLPATLNSMPDRFSCFWFAR